MAEITVVVCSHHFVVKNVTGRARPALDNFARKYIQYGLVREQGRYRRAPLRTYAAATATRSEYRFHINCLESFKQNLEMQEYSLVGDLVEWVTKTPNTGFDTALPILDTWKLREPQEMAVQYALQTTGKRSKLLELQTGAGKSVMAMFAASRIGKRTCMLIRPSYIEKWLIDFTKTFNFDVTDEVLVVQGGAQLLGLLELAKNGDLDSTRIIVISNKTMQNWIKLYEEHGHATFDMGYPCLPEDFCEFIGAGFRIIDEVHQDFHLNFKLDLYTHVEKSLSLSATLISSDDFMMGMYELAYPAFYRFKGIPYNKYIDARSVIYNFSNPSKIRTTEHGSKTYSHHAFEKSLLRNEYLLGKYFDLICNVIRNTYMVRHKPGNRLLIYGASIAFCTRLTAHLRMQWPRFSINRYVEDDPYDYLMESDICVSTLQSAGTAVDIPGLTTVILTPAIRSSAANIQGFGRLRDLKNGTTPQFLYFVCESIPKHITYHEEKKLLLQERALTYREERINQAL